MQLAIKESLLFYSTSDKFQWIITNENKYLAVQINVKFFNFSKNGDPSSSFSYGYRNFSYLKTSYLYSFINFLFYLLYIFVQKAFNSRLLV